MGRSLNSALFTQLQAPLIEPVLLASLAFRSKTEYLCSAGFDIAYSGQTYRGLGTLGGISAIQEGTEIRADGVQLMLSGIDPEILAECIADIQPLKPAELFFGLIHEGAWVGEPYRIFKGVVDSAGVVLNVKSGCTITLRLETRMALLNRASERRLTSADRHAAGYPDDTAFDWVEKLNDIALKWGTS